VLEGFPYSKPQINQLKALRIKPSVVFVFEQAEDESVRRLNNKRMDPQTGDIFNLEVNPPSDEATANRLIEMTEDKEEVVRKRYHNWKATFSMIEDNFKQCLQVVPSERTIEEMTDVLADIITNPV